MRALFLLLLATTEFGLPHVQASPNALWINSGMNNRDITFSPDGSVLLTTIMAPKHQSAVIVISQQENGQWSPLEVAPFSGQFPDIEPAFSPDGKMLFFASRRPKPGRTGTDWDLWQVSFDEDKWGTPVNLGTAINTEGDEFYPSVTMAGTVYFTATRHDTIGKEDLYRSLLTNEGYTSVENIGSPVNSDAYEFNAFIDPEESYLIFGAQGRTGEIGGGDLYISYRVDGTFGEPRRLSSLVNTTRLDYCPTVFNNRLYFTSERMNDSDLSSMERVRALYQNSGNGFGDIYWLEFDEILPE